MTINAGGTSRKLTVDQIKWVAAVVMLASGAFCASGNVRAEEAPKHRALLELFESQGCSSCPSAEEFLAQIATPGFREKAVILSWHVTYWDYLGWKDKFASKAFTERQQKYVATGRVRGLQTPQLMIANAPFSSGAELTETLSREMAKAPVFALNAVAKAEGTKINVTVSLRKLAGAAALNSKIKIIPLLIRNQATTHPLTGENRGAALVERDIVLQAAKASDAENALSTPVTVSFEIPDATDRSNLSVVILLENIETQTTLECISTPVSAN